MSGVVDNVQGAINAQSGRFEFFKQALTLGLAGIGGIAVLFTDAGKIPVEFWARVFVAASGLFALLTVLLALLGIATYANLLPAVAANETVKVARFQTAILQRARLAYVFLFCTGLAFLAFAGVRLWYGVLPVSVDAALGAGKQAMITAVGEPVQVDRYEAGEKEVVINYSVGPQAVKSVVTLERASGMITRMVRTK
jgi:hypothetical protein